LCTIEGSVTDGIDYLKFTTTKGKSMEVGSKKAESLGNYPIKAESFKIELKEDE